MLPVFGLFALAALTGGMLALRPLRSSRPKDVGQGGIPGTMTVRARLWQDPLATVYAHIQAVEAPESQGSGSRLKDLTKGEATRDSLLILPVMIPGGRDADANENRLRARYSILAALGNAGFYPDDPERIAYACLRAKKGEYEECRGKRALAEVLQKDPDIIVMPFETCSRDSIAPGRGSPYERAGVSIPRRRGTSLPSIEPYPTIWS